MEHEMYSAASTTLKMASWQPVLSLFITMTLNTGQGLHSICDKDIRVTSQAKTDDVLLICI